MATIGSQPVWVYAVVYSDGPTTTILGIYSDLQDANAECICHAKSAGIALKHGSSTTGPDSKHLSPVEPVRWDTADGVSCFVEGHCLVPKRVLKPAEATKG